MTLRRLLVVTHETTLTGAPMNLLHFVNWLSANTDIELHTLVLKDGPLRHRFEWVSDVTVLDESAMNSLLAAMQQGLVHLGSRRAWRPIAALRLSPQLRKLRDFDLAYFNSVTSIGVLPYLPPTPVVVNHVHELQVALKSWQPSHDYDLFRTLPHQWIAASQAVSNMLIDDLDLPAERVSLHHEFIDARAVADNVVALRESERCRREFRIPADAAIVMGAGTIDWRKGPDLFIQLAMEVRRRSREPVHFVWVGGDLTGLDMHRLRSDIDRSGADHVHFVGVKPDPMAWFAMADVFALTSREDPFPLVCLEHAALGHPIVTYRNGGIVELLDGAGPAAATGIVEHLDVGAMAHRVLNFLQSDRLRLAAGRELKDRVLAEHDVSSAAPRLLATLESLTSTVGTDPRLIGTIR